MVMRNIVCVVIAVFASCFGMGQSGDVFVGKSFSLSFGLYDESKEEYVWSDETPSTVYVEFKGKEVIIHSDVPKHIIHFEVVYRDDEALAFRAIDQEKQHLEIGLLDEDKSDDILCLFLLYPSYGVYYNLRIIR